jgi:hypothetical protein
MKPTILVPVFAAALVAASASLTPASACVPAGPGQCCAGAQFVENRQFCRIVHCLGQGQFARLSTVKKCSVIGGAARSYRPSTPTHLY